MNFNLCDKPSSAFGHQIEGWILKAVAEPLPSDDRLLFAETVSNVNATCGIPGPLSAEVKES